jgi:hypothetical protein
VPPPDAALVADLVVQPHRLDAEYTGAAGEGVQRLSTAPCSDEQLPEGLRCVPCESEHLVAVVGQGGDVSAQLLDVGSAGCLGRAEGPMVLRLGDQPRMVLGRAGALQVLGRDRRVAVDDRRFQFGDAALRLVGGGHRCLPRRHGRRPIRR